MRLPRFPLVSRSVLRAPALRGAALAVAVCVLAALSGGAPARADISSQLAGARDRVQVLIGRIQTAQRQQQALQARLEVIAEQFSRLQTQLALGRSRIAGLQRQIAVVQAKVGRQQGALDARARMAYEAGPASALAFVLGSTSMANMTDRLELIDAAASSDEQIITKLENVKNELRSRQTQLILVQDHLQQTQQSLEKSSKELSAQLTRQKQLVASLEHDKATAESLATRLSARLQQELRTVDTGGTGGTAGTGGGGRYGGVFQVCPVDPPHAYSDDFGAPRDGPPPHPHMGNDIFAPMGTVIRAPFAGTAVNTPSLLGGKGVTVYGALGYVYNAHLSRFGTLGAVSAGTVVGYVGNTGDAAGGPTHDHFEWHPSVISGHLWRSPYGYTDVDGAIDPYPFLNTVC